MILEKLRIKNFGIFKDENVLDLSSEKNKKLILIIGKNGSGKTTILEAIKLALYGPFLYGFKTANLSYSEKIYSKINTYAIENLEESYVSLELKFSENSENVSYLINRKWKIKEKTLKEEAEFYRNGKKLSEFDISLFENQIHYHLPPSLIDLFFFDGEKLAQLTKNNNIQKQIKDSVDSIFNVNLFSVLKKDLGQFIKQKEIEISLTDEEKELRAKYTILSKIENGIETIEAERSNKLEKVRSLHEEVTMKRNQLRNFGGLEKRELMELQKKYTYLDNKKKILRNNSNEILNNVFPFQISRKQVLKLKEIVSEEVILSQKKDIRKILNENKIIDIAIQQSLDETNVYKEIKKESINNLKESLSENIIELLTRNHKRENEIYEISNFMSKKDIELLDNIIKETGKDLVKEINNNFTKINELNIELFKVKKDIELNVKNTSFEKLFEEIDSGSREIYELEEGIKDLKLETYTVLNEKKVLKKEIEKLENKIDYFNRSDTVSAIIYKVDKICDKFVHLMRERKRTYLEKNVFELFTKLIRKDDLVQKINVTDDYDFELFNGYSSHLNLSQLSAGEKQIFIISILGTLIKASKKTFPTVFDGFLGRLDNSHKNQIITKYILDNKNQIFLLSNDNEINSSDIKKLEKYIARKYTLVYDSQRKSTKIVI